MRKWYMLPIVLGGALFITTLGIDAADTINGSPSTLLASVLFTRSLPTCPAGMVTFKTESATYCIDQFEASVGSECPHPEPSSLQQTTANLQAPHCRPESIASTVPWRFVSRTQAEQLCARSNKRLLTSRIWYQAALGTSDSLVCNTDGTLHKTGEFPECRSGVGVQDMIGNVWELVAGDVVDGLYNGVQLPRSGYVGAVTASGVPVVSQATSSVVYQGDYIWTNATGTYAMMRGGYYGSKDDGGLYSVQAMIPSDFTSSAIGFRCMSIL